MTFAIASQTITGNGCGTFDFSSQSEKIGAFVYGLQQFSLVSGNLLEDIQNFGLSYTVPGGTGVGYSTVQLQQTLADGMDTSSYANVVVLAAFGDDLSDVWLGNDLARMGASSTTLTTPTNPPSVACAVLGAFTSSFDTDSSGLVGIGAGAGLAWVPGEATPTLAPVGFGALLGDDSGYSGSVDVGHIVLDAPSGIYTKMVALTTDSTPFTASWDASLTGYAVFIQSFYMQFFQASYLHSLTVSASSMSNGTEITGTVDLMFLGDSYSPPPGDPRAPVTSTVGSALVVGLA